MKESTSVILVELSSVVVAAIVCHPNLWPRMCVHANTRCALVTKPAQTQSEDAHTHLCSLHVYASVSQKLPFPLVLSVCLWLTLSTPLPDNQCWCWRAVTSVPAMTLGRVASGALGGFYHLRLSHTLESEPYTGASWGILVPTVSLGTFGAQLGSFLSMRVPVGASRSERAVPGDERHAHGGVGVLFWRGRVTVHAVAPGAPSAVCAQRHLALVAFALIATS